jgi:subtilisin family serine protease
MTAASAPFEAPDEIVVANTHLRVVRAKLADLRVGIPAEETDGLLGLTLLKLDSDTVERAAAALPGEDVIVGAGGARQALSVVLREMYRWFRQEYAGWYPTMGTNRILVGTAHNINGGGEGLPRPAKRGLVERDPELGTGVRVGLADTAVYEHPAFGGSLLFSADELWRPDRGHAAVASGHATFVAGLIHQFAPATKLEVEQVLGQDGSADSWSVAKRLVGLAGSGIRVLNLSLQCSPADQEPPLVLTRAIQRIGPDVQVVAAAGNSDARDANDGTRKTVYWPAAYEEVLAVTARDADDRIPDWSAPPDLPWVDCVALGADVVSTYPPLDVANAKDGLAAFVPEAAAAIVSWSGTSFAAAKVTGLIAAEMSSSGADAREATAHLMERARVVADKPWLD